MRTLEFYSGIGGMHAALKTSGLPHEVIKAFEINDSANSIYNEVFDCSYATNRTIESLSEMECLAYDAELWTMSPPCQPFTRLGNKKQGLDSRSSSLYNIIDLIKKIKPPVIFLENVKGFEGSDIWKKLIETLILCNYDIRQFLLTPLQFGVPNCRLRYYLVAKLRTNDDQTMFKFGESTTHLQSFLENIEDNIIRLPIFDVEPMPGCDCVVCTKQVKHIDSIENDYEQYLPFCSPVSSYLLPDNELPEDIYLGQDILKKYYRILDIIEPESHKTACFTKGYGRRYEGTGSFLSLSKVGDIGEHHFPQMRRFHSKEVAKIMCFPDNFEFPPNFTEKQRLKLLGNSINVRVVAHIMHWTLSP
nr:dna methyltransferase 2 [Hymenolepis microstoma]